MGFNICMYILWGFIFVKEENKLLINIVNSFYFGYWFLCLNIYKNIEKRKN